MRMQLNPKNPAIVLFGKEIPLSSNGGGDDASCYDTSFVDKEDRDEELEEETEKKKRCSAEAAEETMQQSSGIATSPDSVTLDVPFVDEEETAKPKSSKTVKKPEKILSCPRCNSRDTKFCYYNNYKVNQPRHFCKSCQRYWTAGGMMRSMQVGAGRRKNKSSSSHYRHITISKALQAAQIDAAANSISHPGFKYRDGIVLKFGGVDPPIRDLTASILNGTNKKVLNGMNRLHIPESGKRHFSNSNGENYDDCSSNSTESVLSSNNDGTENTNFHPQIPSIPAIPFPYPWNYPAILPPPALCTPGFGMPFYPAAFLNCSFLSNCHLPSLVPSNSVPDSSTLEMRARDGEVIDSQNPTKRRNASILVPKTLRVDNPNEAAKSTIWSTLGIKNDSLCREGFDGISPALVSNPDTLLRWSLNFMESTLT